MVITKARQVTMDGFTNFSPSPGEPKNASSKSSLRDISLVSLKFARAGLQSNEKNHYTILVLI